MSPSSLRAAVIARGDLYYHAAAGLLATVVDSGTAFEHVYGERFFDYLDYLDQHPQHEATFHASMADRAGQEATEVAAAYDFGDFAWLVDVGGGSGVLLAEILRATPKLRATLVDRPAALGRARERLRAEGLRERSEYVVADFFHSVPAGADAYLLSRVLHDWPDNEARHILRTCHRAMGLDRRLLLVETVLPEWAKQRPAAIRMDLNMLVLLGAHERTEAQYRQLLREAGFSAVHGPVDRVPHRRERTRSDP